MRRFVLVILILFIYNILYSQEYYSFLSPTGWSNDNGTLIELDEIQEIIDNIVSLDDDLMRIALSSIVKSTKVDDRVTINAENYRLLYSDRSFVKVENNLETDLSENLIIFIIVDSSACLDDYLFTEKKELIFRSHKGEVIYSPYKSSLLNHEKTDLQQPTIFVDIKKYEVVLEGVLVNDITKERYIMGEILGISSRRNIEISFFSIFQTQKIVPVYIQLRNE